MARVTNAILTGSEKAYGTDRAEALLDLTYGGQFGYAPEYAEWVSSQAYVRHNLFCFLLETPKFFQMMPNPEKWVSALKALVELHAQKVDGLNATLSVDFSQHAIGGAGEQMDEPVNVKRETSSVKFDFGPDKYGMPITTFFYNWIVYGIMDPDTKYALANTAGTTANSGIVANDWLADWYTMTCLFVEPDAQHKRVLKSWLVTNMMPKKTPDITGARDLTGQMEMPNAEIEFTGISQFSLGTNVLAQRILNTINMSQANPYLRSAFIEEQKTRGYDVVKGQPDLVYDPLVQKASQDTTINRQGGGVGYSEGINTLELSAKEATDYVKANSSSLAGMNGAM